MDTQTIFYQSSYFYTGQNIQILKNNELNCYSAMYFIPILKILMQKFNWGGNGATLTRLKNSRIMLPMTKKGNIAYSYMESFSKQIITKKIDKYLNYIGM